ncbi:MAG: ABC transporter substrate-binding protein [Pseudomonadota bacterium]
MTRNASSLISAFTGFLVGILCLTAAHAEDPQRIVVAGGDLTEIAFALGAGEEVVGVDSTSTHPQAAKDREQIGYVRRLSAEGVLSLSPDLFIAAHDAGPEAAMAQLEAAGVNVQKMPDAASVEDIPAKIVAVGKALDREEAASALANEFATTLRTVEQKVAKLDGTPKVLFVLSVQRGTPLVGGSNTSAQEMIERAGGINAATGFEGYKPMSREAIINAAPDVLLMMESHAGRSGGLEAVLEMPELAMTPAGQSGRAVTMDGMLLLGFGPRTPDAIAELARALHPEAAAKAGL